jgi:hypothetical protein
MCNYDGLKFNVYMISTIVNRICMFGKVLIDLSSFLQDFIYGMCFIGT